MSVLISICRLFIQRDSLWKFDRRACATGHTETFFNKRLKITSDWQYLVYITQIAHLIHKRLNRNIHWYTHMQVCIKKENKRKQKND